MQKIQDRNVCAGKAFPIVLIVAVIMAMLFSACGGTTKTAVPYVTETDTEATVVIITTEEPTTEEPTTEEPTTEEPTTAETTTEEISERDLSGEDGEAQEYVVNTNTGKFHYPTCASVKDIKSKNRSDRVCTRDELLAAGFVPCKRCNP